MLGMGYKKSQGYHALFVNHLTSRIVTTLPVYVDDIIVTRDDVKGMEKLKRCLVKEFEIKELGKWKYFRSTKVAYSK